MSKFYVFASKLKVLYPKFGVAVKENSKLMKFLFLFIGIFNKSWMSNFTMTIGYTVYMPKALVGSDAGYRVLRHEAMHIADYHKWKILFGLSYLLLLPTVLTFRAYWEFRGYRESMVVEAEDFGYISDSTIDVITEQFTSLNYVWMCPFKSYIKGKLEKARAEIMSKHNGH